MLRKYVTRTTVIIAIGVLAFAGILTAIVLSSRPSADSAIRTTVQIEIRASHRAQIRLDGRPLGTAPRLVDVPASTTPIRVQADYGQGRVVTRSVVPDQNQVVDLN